MKKTIQEYRDAQDYDHDVKGRARILAEVNWNQTKFLAEQAKLGVNLNIYDAKGYTSLGNRSQFESVFNTVKAQASRLKKSINHNHVNWSQKINTPSIDEVVDKWWFAEMKFYIDVDEAGQWDFGISSDDGHQFFIENTLVTQFYGGRFISPPPNYSEKASYTFPAKGRYAATVRLHNIDIDWGFFMGVRTPSMRARGEAMQEISQTRIILPPYGDLTLDQLGPTRNPELVGYNENDPAVKEWKDWREYFPISSVTEGYRPLSGFRYNELNAYNDDAKVMEPSQYIEEEGGYKQNRYYLLSKTFQNFQYWKSDKVSDGSGNIAGCHVVVHYSELLGVNKISFTANLGAVPTSITLSYMNENNQWIDIVKPTDSVKIDTKTGLLTYWIDSTGKWSTTQYVDTDVSVSAKKIRLIVHKINKPGRRFELISISAHKELDISDRVVSMSADMTMDEADFTRIIGKLSANSGSIEISNWDNAFQTDNEINQNIGPADRLKRLAERRVKFTADVIYDLTERGYEKQDYPVRLFTMYGTDWTREGEYDYTVDLFDSAKWLQNTECPDIYEKNQPIHIIAAIILDAVGYGNYRFDSEDFSATSPVLEYFSNEPGATVWETLQALTDNTFSVFYVDEYDVLQLITRDQLTKEEPADYVLRGEVDIAEPEKLPNIVTLSKSYDMEANKVTIKYRPKMVKTTQTPKLNASDNTKAYFDAVNADELTDIVWSSNNNITLQAVRIARDLTREEEDNLWIDQKNTETWPYKGRGNINGEMIAWEGKEYYFMVRTSPMDKAATYEYRYKMCYSEEDRQKCDMQAKTGLYKMNNKFTGLLKLKREEGTNKPIGRGVDKSGYRIPHSIRRRPGWIDATTTIGNPGVYPGFWNGEQSTSFYTADYSPNQTSLEINRPTNRNDDWFKNQILMRNSSPGTRLQQWGARIMFKESTTIGELNFMFNMGQSFGNSEVVTTAGGPPTFNQYYNVSFLETTNLVRNATDEISAWVVTPDPVYRKQDNAIRGSASRMYNRNYASSWADRMKGYKWQFDRNKWYDIKIDLTRGRGYTANADMHFFVWINGSPAGGFNAAGPANRHKFLAPTNYWAIGSRAASKIEIEHAYSWTVFGSDNGDGTTTPNLPGYEAEGTLQSYEQFRYDFTNGGYLSTHLEDGLLYPAKGKSAPYRDGAQFAGEFFYDDFGGMLHEIRDFEVTLDKAPVDGVKLLSTNEGVRELDLRYTANVAKFSVVNVTNKSVIAHGSEDLTGGQSVNHSMVLYGYVLSEEEEQSIERRNTQSIRDRGEVAMDIDANWITSDEQADELARWVVKHFSEPKDVLELEMFPDASYSIGDKVRIVYSNGEIEANWLYIISGITYSYTEGLEVNLTLRRMRNNALEDEHSHPIVSAPPTTTQPTLPAPVEEYSLPTITGADTSTMAKGRVAGVDLMIPFKNNLGSVTFLGGDAFSSPMPGGADWRSPVAFTSTTDPKTGPIVFNKAYKASAEASFNETAPEIMLNQHSANENNPFNTEFTVIPNDGFAFTQTNRQIVSFMSINRWRNASGTNMVGIPGDWRTNYAALAYSDNSNDFTRLAGAGDNAVWWNDTKNSSPFQMQSWDYNPDDGFMYMLSVRAGRQTGPIVLQAVPWEKTFYKSAYRGLYKSGTTWKYGGPDQVTSMFAEKVYGEPSLRRLSDGKWVMAYLTNTIPLAKGGPFGIVTRVSSGGPSGVWSAEKIQVVQKDVPRLYGGFIHPSSTTAANGLILMVSQWTDNYYGVRQFKGSV